MDTFIGSLINNWPEKNDTFIVICNKNHPGLTYLEGLLPENTQLIKHSIKLNWSIATKFISNFSYAFSKDFKTTFTYNPFSNPICAN